MLTSVAPVERTSSADSGTIRWDPGEHGCQVTRAFLVDDHEIVRRGVWGLLDAEDDLTVVGETAIT